MDHSIIDDWVLQLKNHPTAEEIESILRSILNKSSDLNTNFSLVTTLLNFTIPETYNLLPDTTKKLIIQIFGTVTGLGNLISKISLLKDNSKDHDTFTLLETLMLILTGCFDTGLVSNMVLTNPSPSEIKEIDKLLFKGKCFAIVNEIVLNCGIRSHNQIFLSSDNYVGYLNIEVLTLFKDDIDVKTINMFITSLGSFNSSSWSQYFDLMFNESNWSHALKTFKYMKRFEKKNFLLRLIGSFLTKKYLSTKISDEKLASLALLLRPVIEYDLIDKMFLDKIISTSNYETNLLVSILLSNLSDGDFCQLILKLLKTWADEDIMKAEAISLQEYRTHLIILLISRVNNTSFTQDMLKNPIFLRAISSRLSSFSSNVKSLGVILADKVCEFGEHEKIFQLDNIEGYDSLISNETYRHNMKIENITIEDAWNYLNEPEVIEETINVSSDTSDLTNVLEKVSVSKLDSDDESDFESDEEDDPTISRKPHIVKPLYIKDILEYLTVDTNVPQAYEKMRAALISGPTLIRQKSKFGNEVSFYSEDLVTQLVGLTNNYEDNDFEDLRLNCLIAVVVANSSCTLHLYRLLLTGDYSLKQRMCILSATSLAARELKGFKDEVVAKSYNERLFSSKMLPGSLHQKFLSLGSEDDQYVNEKRINPPYESLQGEIMYEASEEAQNKLSGGKILRLSNNLKKKSKQEVLYPKVNNFSKIIGSQFYLPLVSIWYEVGGQIDIGHYSPILTAHYIKTLALLLHAAYPTATNLNDMIKEFFLIVTPLIQKINLDELQIIESIVTGILLICDILDDQYLMMHYHNEIDVFHRWLSLVWEDLIDDKIKSLCAGLLLRINELNEKFERLLLDQMNSIY
ncbi:unnamed protein product [Debaryomyces tyrocola]|nr:unnamed protein product [Debaryomyces tyrocola]